MRPRDPHRATGSKGQKHVRKLVKLAGDVAVHTHMQSGAQLLGGCHDDAEVALVGEVEVLHVRGRETQYLIDFALKGNTELSRSKINGSINRQRHGGTLRMPFSLLSVSSVSPAASRYSRKSSAFRCSLRQKKESSS